jgi:hypothetical protein
VRVVVVPPIRDWEALAGLGSAATQDLTAVELVPEAAEAALVSKP